MGNFKAVKSTTITDMVVDQIQAIGKDSSMTCRHLADRIGWNLSTVHRQMAIMQNRVNARTAKPRWDFVVALEEHGLIKMDNSYYESIVNRLFNEVDELNSDKKALTECINESIEKVLPKMKCDVEGYALRAEWVERAKEVIKNAN